MLDKTKKYRFCGDVYECDTVGGWHCRSRYWTGSEFKHFADGGLVEEIREPREFKSIGWESMDLGTPYVMLQSPLPEWARTACPPANRFEVTIREVLK